MEEKEVWSTKDYTNFVIRFRYFGFVFRQHLLRDFKFETSHFHVVLKGEIN